MSATKVDWDHFWARRLQEPEIFSEDPQTWSDLVWQVGLEDWQRLFEKLSPGKLMLECGCGSARLSRYMAQHRGFQCVMLDYSEEALALSRQQFATLALPGEFIRGDIRRLPFADGQFDVVYSGGVLEFFADIQAPIKEMLRVLKPGGLFAANIVPNKFSCQTLADIQCTVAHAVGSLWRERGRSRFKLQCHLPPGVSRASLGAYVLFCETAGLVSISGRCITPFPALALGQWGGRMYVRLLKRLLPRWRRFNESPSRWHEIWGMAYRIYGTKPE